MALTLPQRPTRDGRATGWLVWHQEHGEFMADNVLNTGPPKQPSRIRLHGDQSSR